MSLTITEYEQPETTQAIMDCVKTIFPSEQGYKHTLTYNENRYRIDVRTQDDLEFKVAQVVVLRSGKMYVNDWKFLKGVR